MPRTIASTALVIAGISRDTATATFLSSRFISRTIASAESRSRFVEAEFRPSVRRCSLATLFLARSFTDPLYRWRECGEIRWQCVDKLCALNVTTVDQGLSFLVCGSKH